MKNQIIKRIAEQTTEVLKEMSKKLVISLEDGSDIVFAYTISELEKRLPEKTFIRLCDDLDEIMDNF